MRINLFHLITNNLNKVYKEIAVAHVAYSRPFAKKIISLVR